MPSPLKDKSYTFAISIVKQCQSLVNDQREFVLSKQLLRSGTAIGALVSEAIYAQSKLDFISKLNIALKEANETEYWISLLMDTGYLTKEEKVKFDAELKELLKMLISSIKTAKANK